MTSRHSALLFMGLGFAFWMAALSSLYAIQATGCQFEWQTIRLGPVGLLRATMYGLIAAHLGALAWLVVHCRRRLAESSGGSAEAFLWRTSFYLGIAAIVATLWIAAVVPLPSICN